MTLGINSRGIVGAGTRGAEGISTDGLCSAIAALSQPPDVRASVALEIICEDYADKQITL